jgi:hypothetical protein
LGSHRLLAHLTLGLLLAQPLTINFTLEMIGFKMNIYDLCINYSPSETLTFITAKVLNELAQYHYFVLGSVQVSIWAALDQE